MNRPYSLSLSLLFRSLPCPVLPLSVARKEYLTAPVRMLRFSQIPFQLHLTAFAIFPLVFAVWEAVFAAVVTVFAFFAAVSTAIFLAWKSRVAD